MIFNKTRISTIYVPFILSFCRFKSCFRCIHRTSTNPVSLATWFVLWSANYPNLTTWFWCMIWNTLHRWLLALFRQTWISIKSSSHRSLMSGKSVKLFDWLVLNQSSNMICQQKLAKSFDWIKSKNQYVKLTWLVGFNLSNYLIGWKGWVNQFDWLINLIGWYKPIKSFDWLTGIGEAVWLVDWMNQKNHWFDELFVLICLLKKTAFKDELWLVK